MIRNTAHQLPERHGGRGGSDVASAVERRGQTGESEAAAVDPQLCCREESAVAPHPPATGNPAKKEMEPCTAHKER